MSDRKRLRILFLSAWFPFPANNGSKLRIANLLQQLAQRHSITLVTFSDTPPAAVTAPPYEEVDVVPWRPFEPDSWTARLGFLSTTPRSLVDTWSKAMADCIRQRLRRAVYDVIVASELTMASYAPCFGNVPAIFDELQLTVLHDQLRMAPSMQSRLRYGLTWLKYTRYLRQLLTRFQASTVVSTAERALAHKYLRGVAPMVIPNAVRVEDYTPTERRALSHRLLFPGSLTYSANHDAMTWYLQEIHPTVRAAVPEVEVLITGDHGNRQLPLQPNVSCTGMVPDIVPLLHSAAATIVPLRSGGGTRFKILESMAAATPVVSTAKGCEGLDVTNEEQLLIANRSEDFARQVIRLLHDPDLGRALANRAAQLVAAKYDWRSVGPRFEEIVVSVARGVRPTLP